MFGSKDVLGRKQASGEAGEPRTLPLMTVLIVLNLAASVDRTIFAALGPAVQASLHLTNPQLGLIQGPAFALPYALALPVAGLLADRYPPRMLLIASLMTWSLGLLICAGTTALAWLIAGRALCGLGQAALAPVALGLIAAGVPRARIGRGIAAFTATGTLGRSLAFGLSGILLGWSVVHRGHEDWSAVLIALVIVPVVPLMLALSFIRLPVVRPAATGLRHGDLSDLWRFVRRFAAPTTMMVVAALGPVVIVQAFTAWAVPVLTQARHLSVAQAGGAIGFVSLAAPAGHLLGGWAMDRLPAGRSAARPLLQAALVMLCIPAVVAFIGAPSLGIALIGGTLLMLLVGAGAIMGLARVQRLAPIAIHGSAVGLFLMLANVLGAGGGPYAVGLLAGIGGVGTALSIVVTVAATIAATGALLDAFRNQNSA